MFHGEKRKKRKIAKKKIIFLSLYFNKKIIELCKLQL